MTWEKLLGVETLYSRKCGLGLAFDTLLVVGLPTLTLIVLFGKPIQLPALSVLTLLGFVLVLVLLARFWLPFFTIWKLANRRQYQGSLDDQSLAWLNQSAVGIELDDVDRAALIETGDGWQLYDIVFDSYRRTKHGRYKSRESFYTVFEVRLRRSVPHLVFDSKTAKRRQFGRLYFKAQQLKFGPVFDRQFASYAPKYYQIDALSFITPEVMEAMLAMPGRDFEFLGDRLVGYAPLLEAEELDRFRTQSLNLHRQVNDNLASYRDDRLDRVRGKQEVADFGQQLLKNPYRNLVLIILSGLLSVAAIVGAIIKVDAYIIFNEASLFAIVLFVALVLTCSTSGARTAAGRQIFWPARIWPAFDLSTDILCYNKRLVKGLKKSGDFGSYD